MKYVKTLGEFISESELKEAEITDPTIKVKISHFYNLQDKISKLQQELESYVSEFKEFEQELAPMMDAMKSTKDRLATTEEFIIEITRYGGETARASYKEAFELALTKVNSATQNILKEALEATKTVSRTKHSFKIRPTIEESSFIEKIASSIKGLVKNFVNIFKKNEDKIEDANEDLKKLAKEKKSR